MIKRYYYLAPGIVTSHNIAAREVIHGDDWHTLLDAIIYGAPKLSIDQSSLSGAGFAEVT